MDKKQLLAIVAKNINVPGLVAEVLEGPIDAALTKLVQDSSMPFDDMAKAALYPILVKEINSLIEAQWQKLVEAEVAAAPEA